ncbi:MAG: hypothetical protein AB1423_14380 [Pseudomonadota bacterium]
MKKLTFKETLLVIAFMLWGIGGFISGYWVREQRMKPIIINVYTQTRPPIIEEVTPKKNYISVSGAGDEGYRSVYEGGTR